MISRFFIVFIVLGALFFSSTTVLHAAIGADCTVNPNVCDAATEACICDDNTTCVKKTCVPKTDSCVTDPQSCVGIDTITVTAPTGDRGTFAGWVNGPVTRFIDQGLIPLMYAIAFLFFMYGITRFFFSDSEEKRKQGREFALWGIVGFVVLFSLWGVIKLLLSILQGR
ncbi:MAG: pilin [Minisyncoccia bacterium]